MKDESLTIRTAYMTALNNVVQYNSVGVPLYDQVPSDTSYPYIYFSGFTSMEDAGADKDRFTKDVTVTLTVCMRFTQNAGSQMPLDNICNQIENIIRGGQTISPGLSFLPDWDNTISAFTGTNFFKEKVADSVVYYRTLKFRHRIQQLT